MSDEYKQSPRIEQVQGNAVYNYYEMPPTPPRKPFRPGRWGWIAGAAAVLGLGGTLVNSQLNAQIVYYCASHNTVKYHTDATCAGLQNCDAKVKAVPLGQAKEKMDLCKKCH
jgi:hypothetical protein